MFCEHSLVYPPTVGVARADAFYASGGQSDKFCCQSGIHIVICHGEAASAGERSA